MKSTMSPSPEGHDVFRAGGKLWPPLQVWRWSKQINASSFPSKRDADNRAAEGVPGGSLSSLQLQVNVPVKRHQLTLRIGSLSHTHDAPCRCTFPMQCISVNARKEVIVNAAMKGNHEQTVSHQSVRVFSSSKLQSRHKPP